MSLVRELLKTLLDLAIKLGDLLPTSENLIEEELSELALEWTSLISNKSPKEQQDWREAAIENLSLSVPSEGGPILKTIKKSYLQLIKKQQTPSSNSLLNMETMSTSCMTVNSVMGVADAGNFMLPDDIRQNIYAENLQKKTGELCSRITYSTGAKEKSFTLKSVRPTLQPNFMIDLKFYDLTKVNVIEIPPQELWRHATVNSKFYIDSITPKSKEILTLCQETTKLMRSSLEQDHQENEKVHGDQPPKKKPKKSTIN